MLNCCFDRYKTQKLCDRAVNASLLALKFVPDWLVTKKMIKTLDDDLFSNDNIIFINEGSCYLYFSDEMGNLV